MLTRYVRSSVLDVLREDYIRTARAKGMTMGQALRRHGLRNAAVPVVTVLGSEPQRAAGRGGGDRERVRHQGLGKLLVDNINNREIILIMDVVMLLTVITLAVNLVVDLLLMAIDPRTCGGRPLSAASGPRAAAGRATGARREARGRVRGTR